MYHQDCKSFQTFCRTDQGPNLSLVAVLAAALLNVKSDNDPNNDKILASILIDADADGFTPAVVEEIHGFLPYEMSGQRKVNSGLVIGSEEGGGVLVTLAGGSRNITAEELNPSIVSTVWKLDKLARNLYDRNEINMFIDDGIRFISSSNSKFYMIVIKLVDSGSTAYVDIRYLKIIFVM